ncbi:unnamed protein product [Auanema sp. JU1783]|nr:unnamed protein product [Auanema sp. JU1783]
MKVQRVPDKAAAAVDRSFAAEARRVEKGASRAIGAVYAKASLLSIWDSETGRLCLLSLRPTTAGFICSDWLGFGLARPICCYCRAPTLNPFLTACPRKLSLFA